MDRTEGVGPIATRLAGVDTDLARADWYRSLSKYEKPHLAKATWQLLNTFVPYIALWTLMVGMLHRGVSYAFVLPLAILAAGLLVRIFIFFHDGCHGSFFASRRANRILGYVCGILTFTPYEDWRRPHAEHHATTGNLERRGVGDIWTLTVEEYLARPRWVRFAYRFFRNPLFLFVVAPMFMFLIVQRFPHKRAGKRERSSVTLTNVAILLVVALASLTIGLRTYLLIQIPIITVAGSIGMWLFYVQHQFEPVYWAHQPQWNPMSAALAGSSYYKLPKVLQWFSGNIGLHHIHHLRPRIPNYNLQQCYNEVHILQAVETLTLGRSLRSMFLHLWDESQQKLVSFRSARRYARQIAQQKST